jgi:dGTPase
MQDALAPYAARRETSRGRLYRDDEAPTRTPFQRDRDRIIHSTAFRRLQYKTQVFVYHEGDHYRTRLTHSLEVSQIARSVCRVLALNEDLAETLALAHDLGHTPFGHAGEEALNELLVPYGGFDHNAQTLRIVTKLEHRYANFPGLNLTWETLEGIVKHNGPLSGPYCRKQDKTSAIPDAIAEYVARHDLEIGTFPGPEAQIAALADDIAYNNHDLDDGLRAGLFAVDDLMELPVVGPVFAQQRRDYPDLTPQQLNNEAIRRLIAYMVNDLLAETKRRLADLSPRSAEDIRHHNAPVVAFSDSFKAAEKAIRQFLHTRMYRHGRVNEMTEEARRIVSELFAMYTAHPEYLPPEWRASDSEQTAGENARRLADFIAGMTDRYAINDHQKFIGSQG